MTKETAAAVAAYKADTDKHRLNFYGYIRPTKNGEAAVTVYCVNETKAHGIRVRAVNRAWTNRNAFQCRDLWKNCWGQLMVEFDEQKNRPQESYGWYGGKWGGRQPWTEEGATWFAPFVRYINLDALAGTRYRYAAADAYHGPLPLVPYLQLYRRHPKAVEWLARAGLSQYITARFLDRLATDKSLARFFRDHARELADATPYQVQRAHANGWTVAKAKTEEATRHRFRGIPADIDRERLATYLERGGIDLRDYRDYLADLARLDRDQAAAAFPRDFHEARRTLHRELEAHYREQAAINAARDAERARQEAERRARQEAAYIAEADEINILLAKAHKRLAARMGDWTAFVLRTPAEFEAEGKAMHNCIGGYARKCAEGLAVCFAIRDADGNSLANVEMTRGGTVQQCRGKYNNETPLEVRTFAEATAKRIARALRAA
jgi:hypothetical protein